MAKPGRNNPCPCGSGKKFKKCCLSGETGPTTRFDWQKMRKTEVELMPVLLEHAERFYGPDAIPQAWDEFTLERDIPLDQKGESGLGQAFYPWFTYNWIPENAGIDQVLYLPEASIAMHYLENSGLKLGSSERRFIEEACAQKFSFLVVRDVVPGKQIILQDLILRRVFSVLERTGSRTLKKGMIIYSRVISLNGVSLIVGNAPTVIPSSYLASFLDMREDFEKRSTVLNLDFLAEYEVELREIYLNICEELKNPIMPTLRNTDGDPLQIRKLYYDLECSPREALDALATLAMVQDIGSLLEEGEYDQKGGLKYVEFSWVKKGDRKRVEWDNTIMGQIVINGDRLVVEVNSQERSDTIKRKITCRLGKRAIYRNSLIQSPEKLLEEKMKNLPDVEVGLGNKRAQDQQVPPEIQADMEEMATRYWEDWLDQPIPALKDQTPREASKTKIGRERLQMLLLQYDHGPAQSSPFNPDIKELKKALQLE